jgi:hypothetical protein
MKTDSKKFQNELSSKTTKGCCLFSGALPYITLQKLSTESGYSEDALRSKIARYDFIEGIHYIKAPDGRIHFIVEAYLEWVESDHIAKGYKLRFTGTENVSAQHLKSHQQKQTLNTHPA